MSTIQIQAAKTIEAAGAAGGVDEVRRLAERGWPESRPLDGDSPELRAAIKAEAARVVVESEPLFTLSVDHQGNTIDVESGTLEGLARDLSEAGYDGPWVRVRSPKDDTTAGWVRASDWKV